MGLGLSVRVVQQYERGVLFRLGRGIGVRDPGLTLIIPLVEVLRRVSLRIVTMPIQSQGIITHDNVSIDVSAVAYYRVTDAVKAVVAIENVAAAINQIAQTTLRKVVGQHTLDQTLAETDTINRAIRRSWTARPRTGGGGDPGRAQRHPAPRHHAAGHGPPGRGRTREAGQDHRFAADQLGAAADVMMAHPLALQLRNLQTLVELGVDKNTTVVFPAPLMSTIQELGTFLAQEHTAATPPPSPTAADPPATDAKPPTEHPPLDVTSLRGRHAMGLRDAMRIKVSAPAGTRLVEGS